MRRCLFCLCLLSAAPPATWAAPPRAVVVFDEAPPTGVPGSRLVVGHGGSRFGRMTPAEAAAVAQVTAAGTLPVSDDSPLAGASCLRISLTSAGWGYWEAELPMPSLAPLGDPDSLLLTLGVRGDAAAAGVEVGLLDGAVPRHAIRLPLARYGEVARSWTLYRIPLTDFTALMPALDLNHLATLVISSSRPAAGTVDVDRILIQTADGGSGPAWVVTPTATRPAHAVPPPVSTPVSPRVTTPARLTAAASPTNPGASEPVDPPRANTVDLPPQPNAPEASALRVATLPTPPLPDNPTVTAPTPPANPPVAPGSPPTPPIRVLQPDDPPLAPPTQPTAPVAPGAPPTAPLTPSAPSGPSAPSAPVVPPGPPPVSPLQPKPEPTDTRPMSVVSVYFGGGPVGPFADSHLRAVWATNRGEREFDVDELKTGFDVTADGRLPIVEDATRPAGVLRLAVKEAGFAWWLARLDLSDGRLSNESNWLKNGRLEIAMRGEAGGEVLRVGLVDGQEQPEMALLPVNRFIGLTSEWQTVRIPLRALKAENARLDWSKVRAAVLASASGKPLTVFIADVRIVNPAQN